MRKLLSEIFLSAASCLLVGCDTFPINSGVDYLPVTTILDEESGYYVELGQIETISSHGYAVFVFANAGPRQKFDADWKPTISVAGIEEEPPSFYISNGCYVLDVRYSYGGLLVKRWRDDNSGHEICFDLRPDRGPKGGFR